ncbi:uncharacterized protein LOC103308104 [Acyrthosiphon pisum]|uniref:DUF4371 domain-containing protein n=1 Tax=Acyrthosiphon pisum TaxID=7029 RepID=A0A8R2B1I4_ACYPI|nr:uncharacterized protein LOC103308104 [Acyrthosiphon pisum]|eukprot:XP_008179068.1 PREDICTED: uncharacterized protein LOC103308104 [Acyrthosiphon pisum]
MSDYEDTPEYPRDQQLTPKKKRQLRNECSKDERQKHRKQQYRDEWEMDPKYKNWLRPEKDDKFRGKCIQCQVSFSSELSCIKKHLASKIHTKSSISNSISTKSIMSTFLSTSKDPLDKQVKNAEIKLAAMLAEHNAAFLFIDHLVPVLKEIFPDSLICQRIQLKRTKATNIIKNVIAPSEKVALSTKLKNVKFSVLIDESTDIACQSTMCVVVRYYDIDSKMIVTRFWDLIQVYDIKDPDNIDKGATAQNL